LGRATAVVYGALVRATTCYGIFLRHMLRMPQKNTTIAYARCAQTVVLLLVFKNVILLNTNSNMAIHFKFYICVTPKTKMPCMTATKNPTNNLKQKLLSITLPCLLGWAFAYLATNV
jgi:hypothetical protein